MKAWSLFIVGATLGALTAAWIMAKDAMSFDPTLTLGNVVQAGATVAIGYFVASIIQRKTQAAVQTERKEVELILKEFECVLKILDELDSHGSDASYKQVAGQLKRLSTTCRSLSKAIRFVGHNKSFSDDVQFLDEIGAIRRASTSTPRIIVEGSSHVHGDIIHWSEEDRILLGTEIQTLRQHIFRAQLVVNKRREFDE